MNLIQSIIMGIVQGLSEFLPISSSAHLVFASNFYKIFNGIDITQATNEEVFFDIMVHLGTLVAVLIFFRKDIIGIVKAFLKAIRTKNWDEPEAKIGLFIILGTSITLVVAAPLNEIAKNLVFSPAIVGILLFITGFMLLYSEHQSKRCEEKKNCLNTKSAILIGLTQGLAALPGFSRSGWTIAAGLFSKLDRVTAAKYSFLLSIPIIFLASMGYPFFKIDITEALSYNWQAIGAGTVTSAVTGYLCIKYFMQFISKFSLAFFGYYCLLAGAGTAVFFYIWG